MSDVSFSASERTFILIKPDAVAAGHVGEIITRIERKGLVMDALRLFVPPREVVEEHYSEHAGKPFFSAMVDFVASGPVVAGILSGTNAIAAWRQLCGETDPVAGACVGSIRGDFALSLEANAVHGSDSRESAEREIALWFPEES